MSLRGLNLRARPPARPHARTPARPRAYAATRPPPRQPTDPAYPAHPHPSSPQRCENGSWWEWESAEIQCPSPDGSHVYFSDLPYLPKGVATICELLICATLLYLTKDSITSGSKLSHRFSRASYAKIAKFRLVVAVAMVVDFLAFFLLNNVGNIQVRTGAPPTFRNEPPAAPHAPPGPLLPSSSPPPPHPFTRRSHSGWRGSSASPSSSAATPWSKR